MSVAVMGTVSVSGTAVVASGASVTIQQGASVTIQQGASVTVATVGTVVTVLGTQVVSFVPGVSVHIQEGVSFSVSVATVLTVLGTQVVSIQNAVLSVNVQQGFSITVSGGASTVITILGTQIVSIVPGLSIVGSVSAITAASVPLTSVGAGFPVWIVGGQTATGILAKVTATTGAVVSIVPAVSMSLSDLSTVATILGLEIVSLVPGFSVTATTGTVNRLEVFRTPVSIYVSSTIIGSLTTMLFTINTGNTSVAAGTSSWAVPAGKTFRILSMLPLYATSAVATQGQYAILAAIDAANLTVATTFGVVAIVPMLIGAAPSMPVEYYLGADVAAGTTICPAFVLGTSHSMNGMYIQGYLF